MTVHGVIHNYSLDSFAEARIGGRSRSLTVDETGTWQLAFHTSLYENGPLNVSVRWINPNGEEEDASRTFFIGPAEEIPVEVEDHPMALTSPARPKASGQLAPWLVLVVAALAAVVRRRLRE